MINSVVNIRVSVSRLKPLRSKVEIPSEHPALGVEVEIPSEHPALGVEVEDEDRLNV